MAQGGTTSPHGEACERLFPAPSPAYPLQGRALRLVLLHELHRRQAATVAELVQFIEDYPTPDHARRSKLVSDALRWEVRAGRVSRPQRGRYRFVGATRSRLRRGALLHDASRDWLGAGGRPPPWRDLGWLWAR